MSPATKYQLIVADRDLRKPVIALLQENSLPTNDLGEDAILFALSQKDVVIGTGGLELFSDCALIRSISVKKELRGAGLGKLIAKELEKKAIRSGITCVFLFTTTGKNFFAKLGYEVIDRTDLPASIKNTSEFLFACPSSATAMKKFIR